MRRLERLVNLVATLLEAERPLTAEEVRERVPGYPETHASFRRGFERDKEALRELGIPLVVEELDPSGMPGVQGYRIPKDQYQLPDPGLDADELAALHLAASAVQLDGAQGLQALWKLGGSLPLSNPAPTVAALPGSASLGTLFEAIAARRPVAFRYRSKERCVEPFQLSFRSGRWYLSGRDREHGEERMFRLDRFESTVVTDGPPAAFERPASLGRPPAPWEMGAGEEQTASLLVDADQASWAVMNVGSDAVERWEPDGSVVLRLRVTSPEAFRSFALGFLDHAEVLGPPALRAEMVTWLESLCPD